MLKHGPAKKVTVYVGEDVKHRAEPMYLAVLNFLFHRGVSGATVTKAVAGFGSHHRIHTTRTLEMTENLPIKIEFIEQPSTLDAILPELLGLVGPALVEVQDTVVVTQRDEPHR